jgi:hypothetical protein
MDNDILHRVRVLDFTTTIAGPHCTRLLADLGADVVKIEAPDGELMRTRPPLRDGVSSYFGQLNAGKRSLVLDLKQPAAVDIVKRLVADADLVVENFRPGVMKRLGSTTSPSAPSVPISCSAPCPAMARPGPRPDCPPTRPSSTPPRAMTSRICPTRTAARGPTTTASSSPTC